MNIADRINDFLCEVREHDGFANDKNFDRVAAEVFKHKIKGLIEECSKITDDLEYDPRYEHGWQAVADRIGELIRALDS